MGRSSPPVRFSFPLGTAFSEIPTFFCSFYSPFLCLAWFFRFRLRSFISSTSVLIHLPSLLRQIKPGLGYGQSRQRYGISTVRQPPSASIHFLDFIFFPLSLCFEMSPGRKKGQFLRASALRNCPALLLSPIFRPSIVFPSLFPSDIRSIYLVFYIKILVQSFDCTSIFLVETKGIEPSTS